MEAPKSLLTCRYWAFGPACPDIGPGGDNVCNFAHWDTGRLASDFQQRGTCQYWLKGTCRKGQACWYEHRKTGVDAMYQGPLALNGMNLEIANAAGRSGFNTFNHAALYDLIWSVKRVTLRHCRKDVDIHRLKDPYYPDRYRPSGLGDNSSKKRPAPPPEPPVQATVKLEPQFKIRQRTFKYKNRGGTAIGPKAFSPRVGTNPGSVGTKTDSVNLLSDDEDGGAAKRQKLNTGTPSGFKPEANQSRLRASAANFEPTPGARQEATWSSNANAPVSSSSLGEIVQSNDSLSVSSNESARKCSNGTFTQQHDFVSLIDLDVPMKASFATSALSPFVTSGVPSRTRRSRSNAPVELSVVRNKLDLTTTEMVKCCTIMRKAWGKHQHTLGGPKCAEDMVSLKEIFDEIKEASEKGIHRLDRVKDLVSRM